MKALACILIAIASDASAAPDLSTHVDEPVQSLSVNFGLIQPLLLHGANVEVDYRRGPFVVGYSHGWALEFQGGTVVGEAHDQHLRMHVPYSTGLGLGVEHYFARPALVLDARAEFKLHRFEPEVETEAGLQPLPAYRTVTIGGGVYATWQPWRGDRTLGAIDISASFRYWPNVWSSLGDGYTYANAATGKMETMHAADIGIANTPILVNVSVGYVFE